MPGGREAFADRPHILASMTAPIPTAGGPQGPASAGQADRRSRSLMMRACRREPVERTPVWLMRQAGRYLPEYRSVRERVGFMELCKSPRLSAEVMIATVERLGVDAAIIFSDLLPILEPMGMDLEFTAGEGPVIHNPIRGPADVHRLRELDGVDRLGFVMDVVQATRAGLDDSIPVIGFAGAPFTLASYCIEGGTSRSWLHTKSLMYRHESAWHDLMGRLARAVSRYLVAQFDAGAQIVQLFDSWVGCLGPDDYRRYVLPHSRAALAEASGRGPVIHFATGNPALLPLLAEAGGSVIGVDWRIGLDDAWRAVGHDRAVQGNLDPAVLLADRDTVRRRTLEVLAQAGRRPGHIFNLGHGVLPQTPVENVLELIATVKAGG
jgi:uroporphyrinogen decarboxylase